MRYENSNLLQVRERINFLKNVLNTCMIVSVLLSIAYFLYWGMIISSDILYNDTKDIFLPLAQFFFPNDLSYTIFRNTSFALASLTVPCLFIHYILDLIEEQAAKNEQLKEEAQKRKIAEDTKKTELFQYEIIKNYSICLSIDYETPDGISASNKRALNRTIYTKIGKWINSLDSSARVVQNDVLIFTSSDFSKYDIVYEKIIKSLAKFKKHLESNHKIKFIPSITTDASYNSARLDNIRNSHFEIQSFNHKNRALSSATFAKKYKHLNHKKYIGIPIGEYAYFKGNKIDTYELNVIHKNLTDTLSKL